jgi:cell division protease FtsH
MKLIEFAEELHTVAKGLLEYETLSGDEIKDLIKGIKPSRDDFDDSSPVSPTPKTSVPKSGGATAPQPN